MTCLVPRLAAGLVLCLLTPSGAACQGEQAGRSGRLVLEVPLRGDTDVYLQQPVGATRFDSGVLAVADGMGQTVHYFHPDGRFWRSVGRGGEGPNEFSEPTWMGRCGRDAATVWDFGLMRLTRLDQAASIVDQVGLGRVVELPRPPARMACSQAGAFLALLRLSGERIRGDEVSVLTAPLYAFGGSPEARLIDGAVPVIRWLNAHRNYLPVSPTTYFAASDSLLFMGDSDSGAVRVLDLRGSGRNEWAVDLERRAPTDAHVRQDAEALTVLIWDAATRSEIIGRTMSLPRPELLPAFSGLHVDELGRVWVVTTFPGDATTVLHAFDARGAHLDRVDLPVGLQVYEVRGGRVVGTRLDPATLEPKVLVFAFDPGT